MRTQARWISLIAVVFLALLLWMPVGLPLVQGQAEFARWDIISLNPTTTPPTISPGGVAFAAARNSSQPLTIKLTGSGTFVSPASGGSSHAVTGGGTWETFSGATSTGSGTYSVVELVNYQFASFQTGELIDLIGDTDQRANGNVVLRIEYDDGSTGILGVGCHGAGAPDGIVEGVIATKDFVTYWDAEAPEAGLDKDRTVFHRTK